MLAHNLAGQRAGSAAEIGVITIETVSTLDDHFAVSKVRVVNALRRHRYGSCNVSFLINLSPIFLFCGTYIEC